MYYHKLLLISPGLVQLRMGSQEGQYTEGLKSKAVITRIGKVL